MKKTIILALLALTVGVNAQFTAGTTKASDLIATAVLDTVTTTGTTALYFSIPKSQYSLDASYVIRIDTIANGAASTLAGYAILQQSPDGVNWTARGSSDSVALVKGHDTCVVLVKNDDYKLYSRIKIAPSGTHKTRFGVSYCHKHPFSQIKKYTDLSRYNNDLLESYVKWTVDSFTISDATTTRYNGIGNRVWDGEMTAYVFTDTVAAQTMSGVAYLKASNDGVVWKTLETITLVKQDGVLAFTPVQTNYLSYRIAFRTAGTHKTRFGTGYIVKVK
jgi:hypothetical protein